LNSAYGSTVNNIGKNKISGSENKNSSNNSGHSKEEQNVLLFYLNLNNLDYGDN
jgi:hypothetical protein